MANDNWHVHAGINCCSGCNGYTTYTVTWPPYYETPVVQQGWECPKCKRVYSPSMIMCSYCGNNELTNTVTTSTGTTKDGLVDLGTKTDG